LFFDRIQGLVTTPVQAAILYPQIICAALCRHDFRSEE